MSKHVEFFPEAVKKLMAGVDKLDRAVGDTLGPRGYFAIFDERGQPVVTNDGVTVAKAFELPDPVENMGVRLVRQASIETNRQVGDGTTTAVILTKALLDKGWELVEKGVHPFEVKLAYDMLSYRLNLELPLLAKTARDADVLINVATLAANGDARIGEPVGKLISEIGDKGTTLIDQNEQTTVETELIEGYKFNAGVVSPYFIKQGGIAQIDDPHVILYDGRLASGPDLLKAFELFDTWKFDRLLIVAREVAGPALELLAKNKEAGKLDVVPVFAPGLSKHQQSDYMADLAALTGATVIAEDRGVRIYDIKESDVGRCGRVIATARQTQLLNLPLTDQQLEDYLNSLKDLRKISADDSDKLFIDHRMDLLGQKTGIVKVGATSEFALEEALFRTDDAIHAAQAAYEAGVVPGGGVTLMFLGSQDWKTKFAEFPDDGVKKALLASTACLKAPFERIVRNALGDPKGLWEKLSSPDIDDVLVFNAATGQIDRPFKAGIVDPVKVIQTALTKAFDVAGNIITTKTVIIEEGNAKSN